MSNRLSGQGRLPTGRLIAHSLLMVPVQSVQIPLNVFLPAIFATGYGLSLSVLGPMFLIERLWGALADPVIGLLSDRTRNRWGRRKIWIAAGGIVLAIAGAFLFFPPEPLGVLQLAVTLFAFFLGWSMMQIPFMAWSGELSSDYHERTRIAMFQTVTGYVALFFIMMMPVMVDQLTSGGERLRLHALGAAILIPLAPVLFLSLRAFPDRPETNPRFAVPFRQMLSALAGERLLHRILLADFAILLAQSMRSALFIFFVSHVAGLPQMASGLFLFQYAIGVTAAPIWTAISRRLGKGRTTVLSEILQAAINLGLLLVGRGDLILLAVLTGAQGLTQGAGNLMLRSIMADVAERHRTNTGVDRTALLFSAFSISAKAGTAIGIGLALPLIGAFGFDPRVAVQPAAGLLALSLTFSLGPAMAHACAAWLVRAFAAGEARHRDGGVTAFPPSPGDGVSA